MTPLDELKERLVPFRGMKCECYDIAVDALRLAEFLNKQLREVALRHKDATTKLWARKKLEEASKLFKGEDGVK